MASVKKKKQNRGGRPTKAQAAEKKRIEKNKNIGEGVSKMTEKILRKLDEAFAVDLSIKQACIYAEIAESTYHLWIKKNPKLSERFEAFKNRLSMKSKQNIATEINAGGLAISERYLARKEPEEYGDKMKVEHSGEIGSGSDIHPEDEDLRKKLKTGLMDNIKKRWKNKNKKE